MRRSFLLAPIVPALAFALVTFAQTKEAAAGTELDLNLNLGTALNQANASTTRVDFSLGGGVGLGYRFHVGPWLYIQPELTGQYMQFGFNSQDVGYDRAGTLAGGLRLGLGGIVQPNVFGHLGVGFMGYDCTASGCPGVANSANASVFEMGPLMDIGLGLDFRLIPGFTLGAQLAYNSVIVPSPAAGADADYAAKWFSFGIKAGFEFGQPRRVVYVRGY